jgi:hypothetical protein
MKLLPLVLPGMLLLVISGGADIENTSRLSEWFALAYERDR